MAKHTGTPKISEVYGEYISAACARYGDGQCDGYVVTEHGQHPDGEECICSCHKAHTSCPMDSVAAVEAWHAEQYRLFG